MSMCIKIARFVQCSTLIGTHISQRLLRSVYLCLIAGQTEYSNKVKEKFVLKNLTSALYHRK